MIVETSSVLNHPIRCQNPANLVKNRKALSRAYRTIGKVIWCFEMSATSAAEYFLTVSASIGTEKAWVAIMSGSVKWKGYTYNLASTQFHYGLRTEFVLTDVVPQFSEWADIDKTLDLHYSMEFTLWSCYEQVADRCSSKITCRGIDIIFSPTSLHGISDILKNVDQTSFDVLYPWDIVMFLARFHRKKLRINAFTVSNVAKAANILRCDSILRKCEEVLIRIKNTDMTNESKIEYGNQYGFEALLKHCVTKFDSFAQFYKWMMDEGCNLKNRTRKIMFDEARKKLS